MAFIVLSYVTAHSECGGLPPLLQPTTQPTNRESTPVLWARDDKSRRLYNNQSLVPLYPKLAH